MFGRAKESQILDSIATLSQCYICQEPTFAFDLTDMSSPDSDFDMGQDDPLPMANFLSSKIEKVLSNLINLQERSREESSIEPIKRYVLSFYAICGFATLIINWLQSCFFPLDKNTGHSGPSFVELWNGIWTNWWKSEPRSEKYRHPTLSEHLKHQNNATFLRRRHCGVIKFLRKD